MDATAGPVDNILLLADCYKFSHHKVYPPGTTTLYAYFESRGGKFPYTVFFGLQYILKRWLCGPVLTKAMVEEAKEVMDAVFSREDVFNEEGWNYLLKEHGGYLPLRVRAVPEGSILPTKNVLFTVENTDPAVPWLTKFFETVLVQTWYPMTVATNSRVFKQLIHHYMALTNEDMDSLVFSLLDAGYRGVSSVETAALGGAAHMISFKASDNVAGSSLLRKYYHLKGVAGFSTPSSEHSTVTSWGRTRELAAYKYMLKTFSNGNIACVCDSYNIWKCLEEMWCGELKELVLERGSKGGCVYLRPDSGDPKEVVLKCLEILEKAFGAKINSKGYKILPPCVRIFHADGINLSTLWSAGCVCDSYNIWKCLEDMWCGELKELVLERGSKGGCVYLRPDSGDPKEVVLKCLEILEKAFGAKINSKGYKILPPCVRVIQADGINLKNLWSVLEHMKNNGWSTANASFGAGCSLLQRVDRDTQRCAYKVSYAEVDGHGVEVYKQPITDSGKNSKRGRLTLQRENGVYTTVEGGKGDPSKDLLVTVFENGKLLQDYTFDEIQQRTKITADDIDIIEFMKENKD